MAKPELIARQSRRPSGWLGEIVARVMAFETRPANQIALDQLAVQEGEAVLEVGCGHGRTLARLATTPRVYLAGIDPSEVMVRVARRRMRAHLDAGRGDVSLASSAKIPHADGRFDAVFAVHVVYFWSEPQGDLREIHRVLEPGGRVLLGYRPRDAKALAALPATVYTLRSVSEMEGLLADANFAEVRTVERSLGKLSFACTEARKR
jgi:SAM-dependent methyltransferase